MADAPTLGSLIEGLGLGIVDVLVAPAGLDVRAGEPVIHDPMDPGAFRPGDLVLAVGVDAASHDVAALVRRAGEAGAAAVLLKARGTPLPPEAVEAATLTGVAVLAVSPEFDWGQLHALIRTARATSGEVLVTEGAPVPLGDLFALANAVATMVGGPTTIEDVHSTVLAYSTHDDPIDRPRRDTILGRRVPEAWIERLRRDGVFRRLWASEDVIRIDYSAEVRGFRPRLAIAVRAGGEVLGSIWVAEGRRPLGPQAEAALREAARIAALHLIRHRASEDLERRRLGELLRAVLEGRRPPELLAEALGTPAESWVTVIAVALPGAEPPELALKAEKAVNLFALWCAAYRRRAGTVALGPVAYVVLADPERPDAGRVRALAEDMVTRSREELGGEVRAGVGSSHQGLRNLPLSRREADQALRVLGSGGVGGPVAHVEEVRSHTVLLELEELASRDPSLLRGKVQALVDHDREHGTAYARTLLAYLDAFGDVPAAARSMAVHPNTFRYRLRRLAELAGLDLRDPVERLVTHLQLRLLSR